MSDDNVRPFERPVKAVETRYMNGTAKCISCKHEWKFRTPLGTVWLQCPACSLEMGRAMGAVIPAEGIPLWTCHCGNDLFYITPTEIYCASCGQVSTFS